MAQYQGVLTYADIIDTDENMLMAQKAPTVIRAFLCPHCPNTHIEVGIPGMKLTFRFDPNEAETLAAVITNPVPAQPDELTTSKRPN